MSIGHIVEHVLDHIIFQIFILSGEVFALFATDVYIVTLPYSYPANNILDYIKLFWFVVFCIEFLLSTLFEKHYAFTFNFIVDIIDLISLSTDIDLIWNQVLAQFDYYNFKNNSHLFDLLSSSEFYGVSGISIGKNQMRYFSILGLIGYLKATRIAKVIEMTNKINRNVFKTEKINKVSPKYKFHSRSSALEKPKHKGSIQEAKLSLKYMEMIDEAAEPFEVHDPFGFENYFKPNHQDELEDFNTYNISGEVSVCKSENSLNFDSMIECVEEDETLTKRINDSFFQKDLKSLILNAKGRKIYRKLSRTHSNLNKVKTQLTQTPELYSKWASFNKKIPEVNLNTIQTIFPSKEIPTPTRIKTRQVASAFTSNSKIKLFESIDSSHLSSRSKENKVWMDPTTNRAINPDSREILECEFTSENEKSKKTPIKSVKSIKNVKVPQDAESLNRDNQHLSHIAEKLLLEKQLQKKMTNNVVAMVLIIILSIEITFFTYFQDIIYAQTHNKIESCVNSTINLANEAKKYLESVGNSSESPYISSLNSTISLCFPDYVNTELVGDPDISVLYLNLSKVADLSYLKERYNQLSYLPIVFASERFQKYYSSFSINVDFVYRYIELEDGMVEYLIDITYSSKMEHLFNIIRTIFISALLYLLVVRLFADMSIIVIKPTTELIGKFNQIFNCKTLGILNYQKREDKQDMQLALISHYIDIIYHKRVLRILNNPFHSLRKGSFNKKGFSFRGTGLYIYIRNTVQFDVEALDLVNKIISAVHSHCFGYVGEIFEPNLIIWKANSNEFECKHYEYSRDESTWQSSQGHIGSNFNSFNFNSTLACLCIADLNIYLLSRFQKVIKKLKDKGIILNFLVFEDEFFYGYQLLNGVSLRQVILSTKLDLLVKYVVLKHIIIIF